MCGGFVSLSMPQTHQPLKQKYEEAYHQLNEQQRLAVDHIEGPVMVIAGPGTGKTQILASRIGKILLETDANPDNILCLTYTDAGAVAMRKRLMRFIGPDAYKVNIFTFHAFCNEIIQENLNLFEKTVLDAVSDLEKIELFKELIDTLPKNNPLKRYRGDVYYEIKSLDTLFNNMKKEGWTSDFINTKIDEYLNDLPTRDDYIYKRKQGDFKAGDVNINKLNAEKDKMEKLRAAVGQFDRFQSLMRKRNRYDFNDMINWVIKALEENPNLLSQYQEKYQYILVDEYQDTSGTQNKLISLLIQYWEAPNIFVVGDDDQSIFRFQGANVENMETFRKNYEKDLLTVVLSSNYRSIQPILDLSTALIERNKERLIHSVPGLTKLLNTANPKHLGITTKPRILEYQTERQEMIGIVTRVQKLLQEGVPEGRIGIIYKENKYGEELSHYFKMLNIPVYSKRSLNILTLPLGIKITLLLKYLAAEHDRSFSGDEMLFQVLHLDWFGIPPLLVAELSIEASNKKYEKPPISLRQLISEKAADIPKDLFSAKVHPALKTAANAIEALLAAVPNVTLQQLFEMILEKAGVLNQILQSPDKHWQLQLLTGIFDFIKDETQRNPLLGLQELVNIISLMEHENIPLPIVEVSGTEKGINLLTAHGAKGLEFEHIFLADCNSIRWEKKKKPSQGYTLPDTIFNSTHGHNEEEELRRLFYVALTRAESALNISYCKFKADGKELEPSMFIAELTASSGIAIEKIILEEDLISRFSTLRLSDTLSPEIEKHESIYINRVLEKFVMNVTALNNYLRCTLSFYYKNILRIPSSKNESLEFGSAVHFALEKLFRKMQDSKTEKFPDKSSFIADFEWYMHKHRESFTKEQFARRLEYGDEILGNYYDQNINSFHKIVAVEQSLRGVVNGVPIKGKLDKLEFNGKVVQIIDYKTGDPENGGKKINGPTEKDPNGGDYWRQAAFYKILVDQVSGKNWKAQKTIFDFIEPDKKKKFRQHEITTTPEDISTVTAQITESWEKIQAREFYTGCGKKDCEYCNFVKTNDLAIVLHDNNDQEDL